MGDPDQSKKITEILNCAKLGENLCQVDIKNMEMLIEGEFQAFQEQYASLLGKLDHLETVAKHRMSPFPAAEQPTHLQMDKESRGSKPKAGLRKAKN